MNQVPQAVRNYLKQKLNLEVTRYTASSGGCINHGGEIITNKGSYFLKWNDASRFPSMFETEAGGLALLRSKNCIAIPEVICFAEVDKLQFIVLEFVRASPRLKNFWKQLGRGLAELHKNSNAYFGLDHDNYIGSLRQFNHQHLSWVDFFIYERLEVQVKLARNNRLADDRLTKKFESLYKKLPELLPNENPSLLHGDLWSGNLIVSEKGGPCLIDPAVYYGHREAELSFTQLFGGFDEEFYSSYNAAFPLQPGFPERIDVFNLYPLLVHANLFGQSYLRQVEIILKRFI